MSVTLTERRNQWWAMFHVYRFKADPEACEHPHGLSWLIGMGPMHPMGQVATGCPDCGWLEAWENPRPRGEA